MIPMRIFITGATGVIGARVMPLLIQAGHTVTAVSRSSRHHDTLRRAGATPVATDLFHVAALRRAMAGHDAVINLATHVPSSATKMLLRWAWRENDHIRRDASAAIATAAAAEGLQRMIQESFAPMYPDHGDEWIDESMRVEPSAHTRSAVDAEAAAARFTANGGAGVVLRFGGLYGPDETLLEMLHVMRKGWSPLPGDPNAYFSSLSQDDAASAVVAALDVPAGIYNVVDDEPMRRAEWVRSLASATGIPTPKPIPGWVAALGGSVMRLIARSQRISNRRFREASHWTPRYRSAADAWPDIVKSLPAARAAA
jgi:nucleoside-diphosphate-sugar epimerase